MFRIRIHIARPPQVVFAYLADVENAPRWYEAIQRVDNPSGQPVPHAEVLRSTLTALGAGFAEIVTTDEVLARIG